MGYLRAMRLPVAIIAAALLTALTAVSAQGTTSAYRTPATRGLPTAVYYTLGALKQSDLDLYMRRIRASGARYVRVYLGWASVAPPTRPQNFDPTDPADPAYRWSFPDQVLSAAAAQGLEPLLTIATAPTWAGGRHASPTQLGLFARAAARRYSGSFQGLPRVRYWLAWNEPNLARYLGPQFSHHRLVSTSRYRKMVNAFAASVHAVHRDNIVVAGELAPLDTPTGPGAMKFTRAALCVSARLHSTCKTSWQFDVWSTHPYTSGGPTHKAFGKDGVALGNLPDLRRIVQAARRFHHIRSNRHVQVWQTEFGWNSKPSCRTGVPMTLARRWVAESLYRVWSWHIGLYTWYQLVDYGHSSPYKSGLYFHGKTFRKSRAKPILAAFHFPFVAFKKGSRVSTWGRTPDSRRHVIRLQRSTAHGWATVSTLVANSSGIFFRTLHLPRAKTSWKLRALLVGTSQHSPGFSLRSVPDRFYRPFGC
jgi:hypothetical protein